MEIVILFSYSLFNISTNISVRVVQVHLSHRRHRQSLPPLFSLCSWLLYRIQEHFEFNHPWKTLRYKLVPSCVCVSCVCVCVCVYVCVCISMNTNVKRGVDRVTCYSAEHRDLDNAVEWLSSSNASAVSAEW